MVQAPKLQRLRDLKDEIYAQQQRLDGFVTVPRTRRALQRMGEDRADSVDGGDVLDNIKGILAFDPGERVLAHGAYFSKAELNQQRDNYDRVQQQRLLDANTFAALAQDGDMCVFFLVVLCACLC